MLRLAACLLLCALASPARAAFVDFLPTSLSSPPLSITFGADGSLSGSIPIAALFGGDTATNAGQSIPITNGLATFSFGTPAPDGMGGYLDKGGSITVTGTLATQWGGAGSPETLFSMAFLPGELSSNQGGPDGWRTVAPFFGEPSLSADVLGLFGVQAGVPGSLGIGSFLIAFTGTPGGPVDVTRVELEADVAGVPEPGSAVLVALAMVGLAIRRSGRSSISGRPSLDGASHCRSGPASR